MSGTSAKMAGLLKEARTLAVAEFGEPAVRDIPLLVTNIALGLAQLEAARTDRATDTVGD